MNLLLPLMLVIFLSSCYGFQAAQPSAHAPLPPPAPVEREAPPPPAAAAAPATPRAAVDKALWHLNYANGLLEKKK